MFDGIKAILVERSIDCPACGKDLNNGDIMFNDEYRGEYFCGYCEEDYKDAVISEEGEDGLLLK